MNGISRILIICAITTLVSCYLTYMYETNQYEAKISNMVLEYDKKAKEQTEQILEKERTLSAISADLETKNNDKQQKINELQARVDKLITDGTVRLRDPGARTKTCPTGTAKPAAVSDDKAGSDLSEEFTRFLWSEASRADRITEQLNSCQLYILQVNKTVNALE